MHLICTRWTSESRSDILTLDGIDLSPHLVKELRKKKHAKPRYGPGAVEEE
jgi:DNA-binding CsgD family transcriptional regulator